MTAKERLLEHPPTWSEEQARRALLAAEGEPASTVDAWGDLSGMADAVAAETMQRLEEEDAPRDMVRGGAESCARRGLVV